jgi:hypothetical protein
MFTVIHGYINYLTKLYELQGCVPMNEMTVMSSESEYMDIVMASFDFDTNISQHT